MSFNAPPIMPDFCSRRYPFHYTTALNVLAKIGLDINRINIIAVGEYENYKGEIREQAPEPGATLTETTTVTLQIGYPAPVDFFPYQFFFGLRRNRTRADDWEDKSRALFAPFDSAVIRYHALTRYQQLRYNFGLIDRPHLGAFLDLFRFEGKDADLPGRESLLWSRLIPYFHFWAGNPTLVAQALHLLFGYKFEIKESVASQFDIPGELCYHLASRTGRLGRETVLGRSYREIDSTYEIIIKGLRPDDIRDLLPGRLLRRKLEWVLGICMPNNLDYRITLKVESGKATLNDKSGRAFLGYGTHI